MPIGSKSKIITVKKIASKIKKPYHKKNLFCLQKYIEALIEIRLYKHHYLKLEFC